MHNQLDNEMTEEQKLEMFTGLVKCFSEQDDTFEFDGPMMATVKLKDNTYRKKNIGAENFFLTGVSVGKTGLIFAFDFEDSHELFSSLEVLDKDMDKFFPSILGSCVEWFTHEFEDELEKMEDADQNEIVDGMSSFMDFCGTSVSMLTERLSKTEEESAENLSALPMFGVF